MAITGRIPGRVMLTARRHRLAPSTTAASYSSGLMLDMVAR